MSRKHPPSLVRSFGRSQISSLIATVVDFGSLVLLVEKLGVWYVLATAMGAALGAITNFLLGRHWAFDASHAPARGQALRYALVSLGSLLLNAGLVYLITEKLGVNYVGSKAVTALLVGVVYNFPLQRWFVFN